MKKRMIGLLALLMIFAIPITSAADSEYYFVPEVSSVATSGETVEVELWLDIVAPAASGAARINYTYCCANITSYTPNTTFFEDVGVVRLDGQLNIGFTHWEGALPANQPVGSYHLGNLTIKCCSGDCMTDLLFVDCELFDWSGYGPAGPLPFVTTDGTFTCGEPVESECLGTCCNDSECTDPFAENVPCKDCIEAGRYWHPNKDTACFNDVENPPDLCLTSCPECCDGVDNADTDTDVDYPADKQCPCGLSPSEDTGGPPIPELPTLALAGIGILGAILLARKRE